MAIIGIDLGTTTSEVAYVKQEEPTIIPNIQEGNSTVIPSVVLIEKGVVKVGSKAKNQMVLKPKNTICEVKRLLGEVDSVNIDSKKYTPTIISSFILKRVKEIAEFYIGEEVTEAVITVPANFNDIQRRETKKAGEMAGLTVDRIINEPTAAAIAYGINNLNEDEKVLVYDFGGGTFDVSILELCDGILDVKCSRGDNQLGGKDIDNKMIQLIVDKFYEKTNITLDKENPRILSVLKRISEEGKINLSTEESTEIVAPYIAVINNEPIDLDVVIYRNEFESLIKSIIEKTENLIDEAMNAANITNDDINHVILVGGSTRIPFVRKMINEKFGDKIVSGINPEETIALGAAIQGQIKSGLEKRLIITDACSYTLGVEVVNNGFDPIIERDSKLPAEVTKGYVTVDDNQEVATIRIYEGQCDDIRGDTFITSFDLNGLPAAMKGNEHVDITFRYDLNGILNVTATIASTGKNIKKKIDIENKTIIVDENITDDGNDSNSNNELIKNSKELTEVLVVEDSENTDLAEDINGQGDVSFINNDVSSENAVEEIKEEKKITNTVEESEEEAINTEKEGKEEEIINNEEVKGEEVMVDINENQVYSDTVALTNYINAKMDTYDKELQDTIKDKLSDLLTAIRQNEFQLAVKIQKDILNILPEDDEE